MELSARAVSYAVYFIIIYRLKSGGTQGGATAARRRAIKHAAAARKLYNKWLVSLEKPVTSESLPTTESSTANKPAKAPRRMRHLAPVLLVVVLVGLVLWFVPPVWQLHQGPVKVERWNKKQGKITLVAIGPHEPDWVAIKRVSRHTIHAVLAAEDGKFYEHRGFDFEAMRSAWELNKKRGYYVRGGSTISQQTIKMAFLGREKTLLRKAREALGTVLAETLLSKDQILEWYLNLAEFGEGVYGIKAGAMHYFKTRPELLTIEQSIHLALILPSPNKWSNGLRSKKLTRFGQKRFAAICNNMKTSGHISKSQWALTMRFGDFGRPIAGYEEMLAAENRGGVLCPGLPGCPDEDFGPNEEGLSENQVVPWPSGNVTPPAPSSGQPAATANTAKAVATSTSAAPASPEKPLAPLPQGAQTGPEAATANTPGTSPAAGDNAGGGEDDEDQGNSDDNDYDF